MVNNIIIAFFCRLITFYSIQRYAYQSHHSGLCIFSETFKNVTIRAYVGLRVKAK